MRKLYVALLSFILPVSVSAQSLTATNQYISGDPTTTLEGHVTITNVSSSTKSVIVERKSSNITPGHVSYFCWAQCYAPFVSVSPDTVQLTPGSDTDIFRGDLDVNGVSGISMVSYCFYDISNPSDSVCVEYVYNALTGLADISGKNYVSKAFPNPAVDNTTIYYNLSRSTRVAQIKIFNMLGAEVRSINLSETKGNLRIPVSGLKPGVYFYTLMADGKSASTGKFMVSRN